MKKKAKMKNKVKAKAKINPSARSKKNTPEGSGLPDLVTAMLKVAERLEALEKKMDLMMSQPSAVRQDEKHRADAQSSPVERAEIVQQPAPSAVHSKQNVNPNLQRQATQTAQPHPPGRERPLYQAVCADCSKECQIPFKPSGERPVYCKECFAKRKAERRQPPKPNAEPLQPAPMQQRVMNVRRHGVGKVTVSEMVPASAAPQAQRPPHPRSQKRHHPQASRSK